jgi:photosynthetic reaction center H subunit
MGTGAITQSIDVAQLVLYMFWAFFAGLIYYLVRENHREGYPMESTTGRGIITGWPVPAAKTYLLPHGGEVTIPNLTPSSRPLMAEPSYPWSGSPIVPTGNPMLDGVGPGSWCDRADTPDLTFDGHVKIIPLRLAPDYAIYSSNSDPRGMDVLGADGEVGGTVTDLWLDMSETLFRYLEVELPDRSRRVLLPMNFARVTSREVKVGAILGHQFVDVPATRHAEQVTILEEEKIAAYYGGGTLYAEPSRSEPLL